MVSDSSTESKLLLQKLQSSSELEFLDDLSSLESLVNRLSLQDPSYSDLNSSFLNTLPQIVLAILNRTKHIPESLSKTEHILSLILKQLPNYHTSYKYLESIRLLIDIDKPLYQNFLQDPKEGSWNPKRDPELIWKSTIKIGSMIDAVKVHIQSDRKCWARGIVKDIDQDDNIKIQFEEEGMEYDRVLNRTSNEIGPYRKHSSGDMWRENLKPGDLIDCFDISNLWYNSTVLDRRVVVNTNETQTVEVYIGFRVYSVCGEKSDEKGQYRGWSNKYDDWISIRSPRIAPFGLHGRMWVIPQVTFNEEKIIDDSNDMLEDTINTFCVTRAKKCTSALLISIINTFGENKLFDFILKLLSDTEKWPTFDQVYSLSYFVGKLYSLYHKKFIMNFALKFKDTVFNCLLHAPQAIYREYSKEKLDQIFEFMELILKRVLTIQQKNAIVDEFLLEFSLKNFNTPYLERRIHGVKGIIDAVNKAKLSKTRGIQAEDLIKWIQNHEIVAEIFGTNGHYQLVQRSGEILKLLATENALRPSDLNHVWMSSQRNDEDMRKTIYSVLIEINSVLKSDALDFLVQKISELPTSRILKEEINLIYELTKFTVRAGVASNRACDFFHKVILLSDEHSETTKNQCLEAYCNILRSWEKSKVRPAVMAQCVDCIRENRATLFAIKIIEKLLQTFPVAYMSRDMPTRNSVTQDLINDQGALTALFDNIENYKNNVGQDLPGYCEEIGHRLNFLKNLISECYNIRVTERQLAILWDSLYERAFSDAEKSTLIKWLSETTYSQLSFKKIFEDSDLCKFFEEKIGNPSNDFKNFTIEEFSVFKNLFIVVNLSLNKIKRLYTNLSQGTSEAPVEFDYSITVLPIQLQGMQSLRKIILQSISEKVTNQSAELLYELYNHTNIEDISGIRKEIVSYLVENIENGENFHKKKALEILKRFIEECEKDGTGSLISHSALLKGDIHTITVINNISYNIQDNEIPKKFEIKAYSNYTLWHVRCLIGKKVKCLYDQFKVMVGGILSALEIKDRENGRTLADLRFRLNENLTISRRTMTKPKAQLLTSDNRLTIKAEKIFRSWYFIYADKGDKMSPEGCAAFTNSCTGDSCKATNKRIVDFFNLYDEDKDGFITIDDFLKFYTISCISKPTTVWNNLASHHYRTDLKRYDDSDDENSVDITQLPTYILIQNPENFDLLFSTLHNKELATYAWELLLKLPTSPQIMDKISNWQSSSSWENAFIEGSSQSMLYMLQVVESFMQDYPEGKDGEKEKRRDWKIKFVKSGGITSLFGVMKKFEYAEDNYQKACLASVVKIMSIFILAAFSAQKPEICEAIDLVRKESENFDVFEEVNNEEVKNKSLETSPKKEDESVYRNSEVFRALVEDISRENLIETIVLAVDFDEIIDNLMSLMANVVCKEEYEPEDKHLIDSALELWMSCILHKNELIEAVYKFSKNSMDFERFFVLSMIRPKLFVIRKSFQQSYLSISRKIDGLSQYFLRVLIAFIKNPLDSSDCSQLFDLTLELVSIDTISPSQNYLNLISDLCSKILIHPCKEKKYSVISDKELLGLLKLSTKIFQSFPEYRQQIISPDYLQQFFKDILFPDDCSFENLSYNQEYLENISPQLPPKAKMRETRFAAYNFLITVSENDPYFLEIIIECLKNIKNRVRSIKNWTYSPTFEQKSVHGYAGIANLGAICYMNSMLQQFFMIQQFRYSILDTDDGVFPDMVQLKPDIAARYKCDNEIDDNLLHQLQRIFGFLEATDRQAYIPGAFCYAFKDFSGNPANLSIQQDSQEFLNMIFDKLDKCLAHTPYKNLIHDTFGGKTCNQTICKECSNTNETIENFFNLSLDVKHSKTVYESLNKLISGSVISDYHCDKCEKKVEITRRALINDLPNILILHLQRIVFNFDTYANEKINSRLEFPHELNIYPYTKEALSGGESNDNFLYELVGIVVHTGKAEAGHYYSYIKDKTSNKKWLEFNDSMIRFFNPENIEQECFGGGEDGGFAKLDSSSRNAYMLVYEKKLNKSPLHILNILECDSTTQSRISTREFQDLKKTIPPSVYQSILKDNQSFQTEKHIFSLDFFEFVSTIFKKSFIYHNITNLCLDYTINLVCHASSNKSLPTLVFILKSCFEKYPNSEVNFLQSLVSSNMEILITYLLVSLEKTTRENYALLLSIALKISAEKDFVEGSLARVIVDGLLMLIPQDLTKHSVKFEQFWQLFAYLSESPTLAMYILQKDAIAVFIDFFLGGSSPLAKVADKKESIGNRMWTPNFKYLITCIANLMDYVWNKHTQGFYELSENDEKCIKDKEFYDKAIKNNYDLGGIGKIIRFFAVEDLEFSMMIAEILVKGINEVDIDEAQVFYTVMEEFFGVEDFLKSKDYVGYRVQWVIGMPALVCQKDYLGFKFGTKIIKTIDDEVFHYPSTLFFDSLTSKNSLLGTVWNHRKRWDHSCLASTCNFLKLMIKHPYLHSYVCSVPAPTYQYSNFMQWVDSYVQTSKTSVGSTTKKETLYQECVKLLSNLPQASDVPRFLIGKVVEELPIDLQEKDSLKIKTHKLICNYKESQPTGKHNLALPKLDQYLEKSAKLSESCGSNDSPFPSHLQNPHPEDNTEKHNTKPKNDSILIIEAQNNHNESKHIELEFFTNTSAYYYPLSPITLNIPSLTSQIILAIYKENPILDWDEFSIKWDFVKPKKCKSKESTENFNENIELFGLDDIGMNVSDFEEEVVAPYGEVSCPRCTFLNKVAELKCTMCSLIFTKK